MSDGDWHQGRARGGGIYARGGQARRVFAQGDQAGPYGMSEAKLQRACKRERKRGTERRLLRRLSFTASIHVARGI